jgi:uncharacterized protein with GYD domain
MAEDQQLYVVLMQLTDRGAVDTAALADNLAHAVGAFEASGAVILSVDATLGEYDFVVRCTGLNQETMLAAAYAVARQGMFRTRTLPGTQKERFDAVERLVPREPIGPSLYPRIS